MEAFNNLKNKQVYDHYYDKLLTWIPSKSNIESTNVFKELYMIILGIDFSPIVDGFATRVRSIKYDFVEGATTSGAVCFFGSVIMSLVQLGYINNIEELFTLTSCYMIIDNYLDDESIPLTEKKNTIKSLHQYINGQPIKQNNSFINVIGHKYKNMVKKLPNCETYLKELFKAETETTILQQNSNLTYDEYLHICEWKGGMTCEVIQSIIGLPVTSSEYDLGACIQLVDDLMDVTDDIKMGINTIVTHSYKTDGNLDNIMLYMVDRIYNMDNKYNLFKLVLFMGLTLGIHINRTMYSKKILIFMNQFIHYSSDTTKESLISWFEDIS